MRRFGRLPSCWLILTLRRSLGEVELGLVVVAAFDDGVDDVGLAASGDLLADKVPDLGGALVGHAARDDRGAAGGSSSMTLASRSP